MRAQLVAGLDGGLGLLLCLIRVDNRRIVILRVLRRGWIEPDETTLVQLADAHPTTEPSDALNDFDILWVDYAREQYLTLDEHARGVLDTHLALLAKDPIANARYDPNTDRWSSDRYDPNTDRWSSDFDGGLRWSAHRSLEWWRAGTGGATGRC